MRMTRMTMTREREERVTKRAREALLRGGEGIVIQ
jgi:hypothetical protein